MRAARNGHNGTMMLLLDRGADIDVADLVSFAKCMDVEKYSIEYLALSCITAISKGMDSEG
jgi:hypothetical protein